jgi:hypothetical protein
MSGWKTGDTYPPLVGNVQNAGIPVDLTGAEQVLVYIRRPDGSVLVKIPALGGTIGAWSANWYLDDLSIAGTYNVEVEVTWAQGAIQTFPGDSYANFTVTQELA